MLNRVKTGSVRSKKVIGDRGLLQLWVPKGELRQRLVEAVHEMLGHVGRDKTFQMMHDKFYWPGMYTTVEKHCSLCMNCQLHAPKPAVAPMQGHVEADKPEDYAAMDILHMEEANGYKFLLTVTDVHSRYGRTIPSEEITAAAVLRAVEDWVVPGGFGRCRKRLIDGDSEFKSETEEALEAWNSRVHVSAAEHYESHGIIEKYNRSLVNKIAKVLYDTEDGTWMEVRAAAFEGYNCSFYTAISSSEKMVASMEVRHGRNTISDTMNNWATRKMSTTEYADRLRKKIDEMSQWVRDSRQNYQHWMEKSSKRKNHKLRVSDQGEVVLMYKPLKSHKLNKSRRSRGGRTELRGHTAQV